MILPYLPLLRRYARALTGSQRTGDAAVAAALEAIIADPEQFPTDTAPRLALYSIFQRAWQRASHVEAAPADDLDRMEEIARRRLTSLTPMSRQALLLTALERFSREEASCILGVDTGEVDALVASAIGEIERQTATTVLVIEDEPIIAMDLVSIVESLGHSVAAIADTHDSAVEAARNTQPGVILADIKLADGSSGLDAVKDILATFQVPVIFITAFPERLLTGESPEPTFLITKPFRPDTVKATLSQALFFESASSMP
jgi:Response regulator containing CheY-like receiver, AAA-type ATPase, and DNA-binding domains